jgi:hypothetical protein
VLVGNSLFQVIKTCPFLQDAWIFVTGVENKREFRTDKDVKRRINMKVRKCGSLFNL